MRRMLSAEGLVAYVREVKPLKRAFDLIPHHIIITDPDAAILYANEAVTRQTGFSQDEVIGKNPADVWGGHMPAEFYKTMWNTIQHKKQPFAGEVKNRRKDGTEYWQELYISPVLNARGDIRFFIGIEPDVTDRKQREQFQAEFLSLVSHQLNNPLTAVRWALDLLLQDSHLPESDQRVLQHVYEQNQQLSELIHDLLVLARLDKEAIAVQTCNLNQELKDIVASAQERHAAVKIELSLNQEVVSVVAVPSLLRQIFFNLITNATEHADPTAGRVTVAFERSARGIETRITNNGPAISSDDQTRLFTRWQRSAAEGAAQARLGLYIVKLLADFLGWTLTVQSPAQGGEGAVFTVRIPVSS